MPIEEINGLRVHAQTLGRSGPQVVMLHGMIIGSLATWYFSVAPSLATDHRVLMYDLRGHGLSERPPKHYSIRDMADDLDGLLARHTTEPVTLIGHSFGGIVALRYAIDHSERVQRLVLVEAPLPVTSGDWLDSLSTRTAETILDLLPQAQRDAVRRNGRQSSRLLTQVAALLQSTSIMDDLWDEPDIPDEEIRTVQCPVLLCYGRAASHAMGDVSDRLARMLPDARLEMFDGGHFLPQETPGPLSQAIRDFLHA